MMVRLQTAEEQLAAMQRAYDATLRAALRACVAGDRGLFVHETRTRAAADLLERGAEIEELRAYLGLGEYPLHQRFLELRAIRHRSAPGEPSRARTLLVELTGAS
jgi:hypothetical protein